MQEKYLTRDQMQSILDTRPKGVPIKDAVDMYVNNGWTIQGVNEPKKEATLVDKLGERAKTFVSEATLKPSRDILVEGANTTGLEREITGMEAFNRAFQAPIRTAGAIAGAGADIIGAGLEATGLNEPIAKALQPVAQSGVVQSAVKGFKSLPQGTQEVLGDIGNVAGFLPIGAGASAVKSTIPRALNVSAFDAIKSSSGNLTNKALDFLSADPSAKVETILKRATPQELDNYLAIAEKSAQSGEAKSVLEAVGDKMAQTTKTLKTKLDGIGAAKSEVMAKNGNIDFTAQTTPLVSQLEDIMKSFTEIDKAQAPIVEKFIADARNIRTAQQADTFIDKAQDALYTGDRTMVLPSGSALEKRLQKVIGEYNSSLKKVVPEEYAKLNEQYAKLVEALSVINKSLGDTFEGVPLRGSGLVKQYFSPAGSKTKEIFEFIKNETNGEVDLAKDATLAKFAGQLYDDANVESLLGGIKDIPTTAGAVVGKVIEKVGGKQVTNALRSSTVRKAKSSTSPIKPTESVVNTTAPIESKLSPSPNTTPTPTKGKGIKWNSGFIDPTALFAKNPIKINNIVAKLGEEDIAFLKHFTKLSRKGKLTKEERNSMDDFLGEIGIKAKTKDEQATVANLLLEKYDTKK